MVRIFWSSLTLSLLTNHQRRLGTLSGTNGSVETDKANLLNSRIPPESRSKTGHPLLSNTDLGLIRDYRSTLRYDPTRNLGNKDAFVQKASAQPEWSSPQSQPRYMVAPSRQSEPPQTFQYSSRDSYRPDLHGQSRAEHF